MLITDVAGRDNSFTVEFEIISVTDKELKLKDAIDGSTTTWYNLD